MSSVLNRDVKQFGKKFMFDGDEETCWNSDKGSPQSVTLELPSAACVGRLEIRFQGGFTCREGILLAGQEAHTLKEIQKFYPSDDNTLQVSYTSSSLAPQERKNALYKFLINYLKSFAIDSRERNRYYRILFNDSTDFYGRTVVYHLQLYV